MKVLNTLTIAAAAIAACAVISQAEPPAGKGPMAGGPDKMDHKTMLKQEIGLSDDQLKKLEQTRIETEKVVEKCKYDIKAEKLTVQEISVAGTLTKAKLKESLGKINDAKTKIQAAHQQGQLKAFDIFTDEQIKKMADKKILGRFLDDDRDHGMEGKMGKDCPMMKKGECPKKDK